MRWRGGPDCPARPRLYAVPMLPAMVGGALDRKMRGMTIIVGLLNLGDRLTGSRTGLARKRSLPSDQHPRSRLGLPRDACNAGHNRAWPDDPAWVRVRERPDRAAVSLASGRRPRMRCWSNPYELLHGTGSTCPTHVAVVRFL